MKHISIREARQALSRLEELLAEEDVTITRRGRPLARLVGVGGKRPIPSHKDLRESMARVGRGSELLLRDERDAR